MRTDIDLDFLKYCSHTELRELCDLLTHDEKGNLRLSENLTDKDSYIENYPHNCKAIWQDIALELQLTLLPTSSAMDVDLPTRALSMMYVSN